MTGVRATFDDAELRAVLRRLAETGGLTPALKNIGEHLVSSTQNRFEREEAPDGSAWAALSPAYAASKRGPGILREAGFAGGLAGSIAYQVTAGSVSWGSNKIHAAIHQWGGTIRPKNADRLVFALGNAMIFAKEVTIPERPFVGVSSEDRAEIAAILEDFIESALGAR